MEKKLEVKDLVISFRTQAGKVQAVRNISFDLYKGETLAIVGESGSGKSVTSKSIIGISAANAIVENGQILYDGQDLIRIPEEEMHKLRGDKIAMIFQDPLSALDPIMRIGQQITEAMLLKNKESRKNARKDFNKKLAILGNMMTAAVEQGALKGTALESFNQIPEYIDTFDKFNIKAIQLENGYNTARNAAGEVIAMIDDFLFLVEKHQKVDASATVKAVLRKLKAVNDKYLIGGLVDQLNAYMVGLEGIKGSKNPDLAVEQFTNLRAWLQTILEQPQYNFFRIGYYLYKNPTEDLSAMPAEEANQKAYDFLMSDYMTTFLQLAKAAIAYSMQTSIAAKKAAIAALEEGVQFFTKGDFAKKEAYANFKNLNKLVRATIDPLAVIKDNIAYTFGSAMETELDKYFFYVVNNPKEEKRFAKQTARRDALIQRGKKVDWKVVPKSVVPLDMQIQTIVTVLTRVIDKFKADVANVENVDLDQATVALVDYLKETASKVVYKITPRLAKEKAIKLMEEVGIPEPRIRYRQYPFEFSGGMRQRIVIAIALSANPDILICDEPTTALDVTIQAQILELINRLKKERNLSIIFITHDLGVVANMADRIAVMYAGKIVEYGTVDDVFYNPRHPYTWALLSSMPDLDTNEKLDAIPGTPPNMIYPPIGDAFAERNKYAMQIDYEMQPPMFEISPTHFAATWLLHPNAPKVDIPKNITDRIERMKQRREAQGMETEAQPEVVAEETAPVAEAQPEVVAEETAPVVEAQPEVVAEETAPVAEAQPEAVAEETAPVAEAQPEVVAEEIAPVVEAQDQE